MDKRTLVSAIAISMLAAACTTMPGGTDGGTFKNPHKEKAKECNGTGTCFIDVSVSGDNIDVDPPYVIINNKRQRINIFFRPNGGITIEKVDFGDPEFDCGPVGGSDQWKCDDKHSTFGVYKYSVTVKNVGVKDPWLVND